MRLIRFARNDGEGRLSRSHVQADIKTAINHREHGGKELQILDLQNIWDVTSITRWVDRFVRISRLFTLCAPCSPWFKCFF